MPEWLVYWSNTLTRIHCMPASRRLAAWICLHPPEAFKASESTAKHHGFQRLQHTAAREAHIRRPTIDYTRDSLPDQDEGR
jgi:hypothetical protein